MPVIFLGLGVFALWYPARFISLLIAPPVQKLVAPPPSLRVQLAHYYYPNGTPKLAAQGMWNSFTQITLRQAEIKTLTGNLTYALKNKKGRIGLSDGFVVGPTFHTQHCTGDSAAHTEVAYAPDYLIGKLIGIVQGANIEGNADPSKVYLLLGDRASEPKAVVYLYKATGKPSTAKSYAARTAHSIDNHPGNLNCHVPVPDEIETTAPDDPAVRKSKLVGTDLLTGLRTTQVNEGEVSVRIDLIHHTSQDFTLDENGALAAVEVSIL